ncbi:hypothetical protein BBJ66_24820 [Rhizobium sp. RSm-3]|nr:hypothetical protein BBJ66_24820 [Rhizobium sp. RSm-3]
MKMKKGEHARGDCIEDAGFFAFADRSRRHLVECGKKRLGEIAKFAGFDFFRLPAFSRKSVHRQPAGKP